MRVNRNQYVNQIYKTNEGYDVKILQYLERHKVLIQFINYLDVQIWTTMQNIKKGQIKNPYHKDVYNIGYYGIGNYTARNNNIKTEQYIKWSSMFTRCYNKDYQSKQPTYIGCTVDETFWNFQNFAAWYDQNKYDCNYDLELDKDFLVEGNKIYSPSTCCLIPKEMNTLINFKRHDKQMMKKLYDKYKNELPYYLKIHLFELTK